MTEPVRHLYIHIPFCPRKCSYCAFVTHIGSLKLVEPYLSALREELSTIAADHPEASLTTVYFGGGTPSVMSPAQFDATLDHIEQLFGLDADAEVTFEAHPATVDAEKLRDYRLAGATRISYGAETLDASELIEVGRAYTTQRVLEVITQSRVAGFENLALDLIYGLPSQTSGSWLRTLTTALQAGVDHFSLYPLSLEPATVFARRHREGRLSLPPDETVVAMYHLACELLGNAGYEHYEVASWARPGHRCRHNLAYWRNLQYHAAGVGAHGYVKPYRYEHIRQTKQYIDNVANRGQVIAHREHISKATELAETVMLRLRLLEDGLDLDALHRDFGVDLEKSHDHEIDELGALGLITLDQRHLRLTEAAVPVANEVWQRFM